ncbi:MAG: hypothetical protein ING08_10500 [Roseomonas sp.]|nr:hypothetical protein [Roseomonas sp.]MCA3380664.1 hypothetical protein [Roseomonas sp.]
MIPPQYAARAVELAKGITAIAARLPRDWPKEHPPANPACEATTASAKTGEQENG